MAINLKKMKRYKLGKLTIEATNITVEHDNIVLHPERMTIDAVIHYTRPDGKDDVEMIHEIPVQNMNFEPNSLTARTMAHLKKLEIE